MITHFISRYIFEVMTLSITIWADPGFSFTGAQKIMCVSTSQAQSPVRPGSRALETLGGGGGGGGYALSCYLSLIFNHSDTKLDKKNPVDQILGGACLLCPHPKSAADLSYYSVYISAASITNI